MRWALAGIKPRLERLEAAHQAKRGAIDWDATVRFLCSARTEPVVAREMTAEEFAAWAEHLRASARGSEHAKFVERLIAARQREP